MAVWCCTSIQGKAYAFPSSLCFCSTECEIPLSIVCRKMSSFSPAMDRYHLSSDAALMVYPFLLISFCLAIWLEHQIIHALCSHKHCSPTIQPVPPHFHCKLVFIYLSSTLTISCVLFWQCHLWLALGVLLVVCMVFVSLCLALLSSHFSKATSCKPCAMAW